MSRVAITGLNIPALLHSTRTPYFRPRLTIFQAGVLGGCQHHQKNDQQPVCKILSFAQNHPNTAKNRIPWEPPDSNVKYKRRFDF